jgi:glycosyltransferase involved in cell wall biosynthesis
MGSLQLPEAVPIAEQEWPANVVPIVSILCITYNHERFIKDCLEGFLIQETSFPVEIIVHDDASTDGTREVIEAYRSRYPRLIKPVLQDRNQYSQGKKPSVLVLPYASGKFIATCEGDDYWTSPSKLQKQIEFMLGDPNRILCGGRVAVVREENPTARKIEPSQEYRVLSSLTPIDMLYGSWPMRTASRVAKRTIWSDYAERVNDSSLACDHLFKLFCISIGRHNSKAFGCLDEVVAVYREHEGGVWSSADEQTRIRESLKVLKFAIRRFDFGEHREYLEHSVFGYLDRLKNRTFREELDLLKCRILSRLRNIISLQNI